MLTFEDKLRLVAGASIDRTVALPGVPALRFADGPNGIAGRHGDERAHCTPCGTALAATWDRGLVEAVGRLVGEDARRLGVDVVLAPVLNLPRSPLGGRAFESLGEDPCLSGGLGAAWVRGVQSTGVAAAPKHFVANDSETRRRHVDCIIGDRALRELYLAPFEAALRAGAWALMASYNRVNGTPAYEHEELLLRVVREEWGWDGLLLADWYGIQSPVSAANGIDLEMPGPPRAFGEPLAQAVADGRVSEARIHEMADRLLTLATRVTASRAAEDEAPRADAADLLRETAAASFTLLRNDGALLPLVPGAHARIALIGPGIADPCLQGGGTSWVTLGRTVDPLAALSERYAGHATLTHEPGCTARRDGRPLHSFDVTATHAPGEPGLTVELWPEDEPHSATTERTSTLMFKGGVGGRVRVSAVFTPAHDGEHRFSVRAARPVTVRANGREQTLDPSDDGHARPWYAQSGGTTTLDLREGHPIELEFETHFGERFFGLSLACAAPEPPLERAVAAASNADAVVLVVGTHDDLETQGADRPSTALPGEQEELVRRVVAANPATVVVVNAGAQVDLDCARDARALLYGWFGGEAFADALAAVLSGDLEPGGRLPLTLAARPTDYPAYDTTPDDDDRLHYAEGLRVGYRHFDALDIEPAYPFGHGLGYTDFAYEAMTATAHTVDVVIRNVGARRGKEVVQLYVAGALKAFATAVVEPGRTATVRLASDEPWGGGELLVGRSSRDIRLRRTFAPATVGER